MNQLDFSPIPAFPHDFDVVIVGAGAAGLYTALCLPKNLRIALINKNDQPLSASGWAQGGIAAAIAPDDSPQSHLEDTLIAGAGLCDLPAVKFLVEKAPDCVHNLVDLGVAFDRHGTDLALTLEAAHSHKRVLHAADTTGRAIVDTLMSQVLQYPHIQVLSSAFVIDLWLDETKSKCQGVCLAYQNQINWVQARAVVLATGGGGQVFAQTTNPSVSTGDGVAMAWRAGAVLRDLEFFQFHPTALMKTGAPHFLISEAVRGEGAHLVDSQGDRFAFQYHPAGELAPRDVVSRAIFSHLQKTKEPHVWLDLRPIPVDRLHYRFPNIIQVCQKWGVDILQAPIPVSPAAHYWMGGVMADTMNKTSLPGLYAVGETASTGVHGANRLASNSLLECLVFGAEMAKLDTADHLLLAISERIATGTTAIPLNFPQTEISKIESLRQQIPVLLWQSAGICREAESLEIAIKQLNEWRQIFNQMVITQTIASLTPSQVMNWEISDQQQIRNLKIWGETRNLLDISYTILQSALFRQESRGGHFRTDYPHTSPDWQVHTLVTDQKWWKSPPINE